MRHQLGRRPRSLWPCRQFGLSSLYGDVQYAGGGEFRGGAGEGEVWGFDGREKGGGGIGEEFSVGD